MNLPRFVFALLLATGACAQCWATNIHTVLTFPSSATPLVPNINDQGGIAFAAYLPGLNNWEGFSQPGGGPAAATVVPGRSAPGLPLGVVLDGSTDVYSDNFGRAGYSAHVRGSGVTPGVNDFAVWSLNNGSPALAMRLGDQAPGTAPGVNFSVIGTSGTDRFAYSKNGDVTFAALVTGPGITNANKAGIWTSHAGATGLVAQLGNQAPGMPAGMVYSEFVDGGFIRATVNANGQTAISARTTGPGATTGEGIWLGTPGNMQLFAQRGDAAPGLPGNTLQAFGELSINNQNHVAFLGYPSGPPGTSFGIWSGAAGTLSLLAATSQPALGAGAGVNFGQIGAPAISGSDKVAFVSVLTGAGVNSTNDTSIWLSSGGGLKMIAREGSQAPGLPAGYKLDNLFFSTDSSFAVNSAGQVAFAATYRDLLGNYYRGLWETDANGNVAPVLTENQTILVNGVPKTIYVLYTQLGRSGLQDGQWSGFSENGQIAFLAGFTDGTWGEFVADPVLVPEPSSVALAAVGVLGLLVFRRCRRRRRAGR